MTTLTLDAALSRIGTGRFQYRLLAIFGLVWAADAMQVLSIGFTSPAIAQTFGLPVETAIRDIGTLFFLGMLIGAWGFGQLADRFGRRRVMIVTVLMDAICGVASAAAGSYELLLLFRFLTGMAVGGTLPIDCSMLAEFLPPERRGRWLVMLEVFWAFGMSIIAAATWLAVQQTWLEPWRLIFIVTGTPALIGIGLRFWIPESPYHLARSGRTADVKAVFARIARANGKPPLTEDIVAEAQPHRGFAQLFAGDLRRRSLLILTVWFVVSAVYYGVVIWLPGWLVRGDESRLGFVRGDGFLALLLLAQVPGFLLAALGVERIGRRLTLIAFLLFSAGGCVLFIVASTPLVFAIALLIMSFALVGTWGGLYTFTPELYPTTLRATGMGAASAMARLGGMLAPSAVASLVAVSFSAAIGLFAALLLLGAVATLAIPVETRQAPLR